MNLTIQTFVLFIFTALFSNCIFAQSQLDLKLKEELREIDKNDQELRKIYFIEKVFNSKSDSLKAKYNVSDDDKLKEILANKIEQTDSLNLIKIDRII